jgi:hypothetical protein
MIFRDSPIPLVGALREALLKKIPYYFLQTIREMVLLAAEQKAKQQNRCMWWHQENPCLIAL